MRKTILALCVLFAYACTTDTASIGTSVDENERATIIYSADHAQSGQLLVKFDTDAVPTIAPNATASRSGIAVFDDVAVTRAASLQMRRLIPYNESFEAGLREFDLDRWYLLEFDEDTDLKTLAEAIADCGAVTAVEYAVSMKLQNQPIDPSKMAHSASEGFAAPSASPAATRTASVFDDPYLNYQWHYINTAQSAVAKRIAAGADIGVEQVWRNCTTGDPSVIVAVVDEGVQVAHPDLQPNIWVNSDEIAGNGKDDDGNGYIDDVNGFNFAYNQGTITFDEYVDSNNYDSGHGTHVAGTVAAVNNNGKGVCGMAGGSGNNDGVKIMSCQIFGAKRSATTATIAQAITYAAQNGAVILQCSWGFDAGIMTSDVSFASNSQSSVEKNAIDFFVAKARNATIDGGIVVFAAGNESTAMAGYPGAYHDYISVAAMAPDYTGTFYTNYNLGVNITAPGGDVYQDITASVNAGSYTPAVLSTLPTSFSTANENVAAPGYGYMQGTSMACPHVSGVAALAISYAKQLGKHLTARQLRNILVTSAEDINPYCTGTGYYFNDYGAKNSYEQSQFLNKLGAGYINAYRVMMQIKGTPCVTVNNLNTLTAIPLNKHFGEQAATFAYGDVVITDEEKARMGVDRCYIQNGQLMFRCSKAGAVTVKVTAIIGGRVVGGSTIGGQAVEREFAIIVRPSLNDNGYWL